MRHLMLLVLGVGLIASQARASYTAVATAGSGQGEVYDVTRNNIFWNNATDIQNNALDISDPSNQTNTNPLFVHHTRPLLGETIVDYEWAGAEDGYYLSQRELDASRRAFRLGNLSSANPDGISNVTDFYGLVYYIYVGVSEGIPSDSSIFNNSMRKGAYEVNEDEEFYIPGGDQQGEGPTWIVIMPEEKSNVQLGANPHFRLTTTNGTILDVYLPPDLTISSTYGLALFLAEDGSTFWGNSSHDITGANYFNQDAYYSLRWDTTNPAGMYQLARSAYDAAGASPAIDEGSRDFLNNGYTSTDLGNIADEYDQTNPNRDNPNTSEDTDDSLYERLDIGYHYFGSLRHPRERIPAIPVFVALEPWEEPYWYTPNFKVQKAHQVAIASGPYNPDPEIDFPDTTIAAFGANYIHYGSYYAFLLFHQFRSQNNNGAIYVYGPFDEFRFPEIDRVAMTASTENDNPAGVIYAACTVNWYDSLEVERHRGQTQLNVYRYNNDGTWTLIGQYTLTDPGAAPACLEVALAVRNQGARQDLWVFWTEGFIGDLGFIFGDRIQNAATLAGPQALVGVPLRGLIMAYDQAQALDADWDREWYQHPSGNPRIIWSQITDYERWGVYESWVRLDLQTGDPTNLGNVLPVGVDQGGEIDYTYPSIAVNQPFLINQQRAFASFARSVPPSPGVWARTNTMNMGGAWGQPVEFDAPTEQSSRQHPDVASRFIETRRICFLQAHQYHDLFTNTEWVNPDGPAIDGEFPRIATNGANLIDQFLVFASAWWTPSVDSTIDLFQIDP